MAAVSWPGAVFPCCLPFQQDPFCFFLFKILNQFSPPFLLRVPHSNWAAKLQVCKTLSGYCLIRPPALKVCWREVPRYPQELIFLVSFSEHPRYLVSTASASAIFCIDPFYCSILHMIARDDKQQGARLPSLVRSL